MLRLALLTLVTTGCLVSDVAYHDLAHPERRQRIVEVVGCSVVERDAQLSASVVVRFAGGGRFLFDEGLTGQRGEPEEAPQLDALLGRPWSGELPKGNVPCVRADSHAPANAAVVVLDDSSSRPKLYVLVPSREGSEDCLGCRLPRGARPEGTRLALPSWPSRKGIAAFVLLLPLLLPADLIAGWEAWFFCSIATRKWDGCMGRQVLRP